MNPYIVVYQSHDRTSIDCRATQEAMEKRLLDLIEDDRVEVLGWTKVERTSVITTLLDYDYTPATDSSVTLKPTYATRGTA